MNSEITPAAIAPTAANYAHAVVVEAPGRLLHTSGIVPIAPDGSVPEQIVDQAATVWANIVAILAAADFATSDVVSVTTYVLATEIGSLGAVMSARDRALDGHRAASTLVTVPLLARPEWKMEIAVVAAR
ncbi:MAG: Rid family hydrolase [Ilumatobacteraceae bacterium]